MSTRPIDVVEVTIQATDLPPIDMAELRALWSVVEHADGFGVRHASMLDASVVDDFDDRWPTREAAQAALDEALAKPVDMAPWHFVRLLSLDEPPVDGLCRCVAIEPKGA